MIHQLRDIQDNERHWSWLHVIIGSLVLLCRSRTIYVSECDRCQRMQSFPEKPAGRLKHNEAISQPWKDITIDFITGLPEAQGYDALFVTCCCHTKQAHIIPTSMTTSARGLATLFRNHVWKLHGLPETALSDRGPKFAAEFMKELNEILGIKIKLCIYSISPPD